MDFRAKQEAEAVERMKLLELIPNVISEFQNEKVINKFRVCPCFALSIDVTAIHL